MRRRPSGSGVFCPDKIVDYDDTDLACEAYSPAESRVHLVYEFAFGSIVLREDAHVKIDDINLIDKLLRTATLASLWT